MIYTNPLTVRITAKQQTKNSQAIEIDFDRSVIIDDTAERLQDLQEVRDGIKAPWEFRVKYYGDTEDDAKRILDEIKGVEVVDLGFEDGDG